MRIFGSLFSSQRLVFFLFFLLAIFLAKTPCQIASFPFLETFEGEQLASCWETWSSDSSGEIIKASSSILMLKRRADYSDSLYVRNAPNLNELTLSVNMAGQSGVYLSFHINAFTQTQAVPDSFTGHYDGNAVAISPDGVNWHRAVDLSAPRFYEKIVVNLDSIIDLHQISYTSDFKVRFMHFSQGSASDYIVLDSIHIYTPPNNRVVFLSNANGSVTTGDTLSMLSGFNYKIQAQPEDGYGFSKWEVISGDVVIDDPYKRSTECRTSDDAVIEAVFKEGTRVYEVGHDETTFSFSSHGYTGGRSKEIRFKHTRRSDERLAVRISGHRGVYYYLSHQLYGKDSTYSSPINLDSRTAGYSQKTILLDPGSEGDTHYFSIFCDNRWVSRHTLTVKVNPIHEVIVDTSRGGSAEISSIYGQSGDRFTVEALPLPGYRFKDWEILDGESIIEQIKESDATIRIYSDSRIRPVFQKDSTTIEEIQASEKTEIVIPRLQNSIRLKIADCDSGNYAVRFDWNTSIREANYHMHDTDSTFADIVDSYSSQNNTVGLPLHIPYQGKTFYMTLNEPTTHTARGVEISLEKLNRCSTFVSGNGTILPSHPVFFSPVLPRTIKAVAQDPNTSFKCWEIVSGDGILSDRYNPRLTFYGSTDLTLKAVFEPRNITQLQTGNNVVSAAPEQTSKYFDLVYETPDSGNYLFEAKYFEDLKYYGQDSTFSDVVDTISKRIPFHSSSSGQKHYFRMLPSKGYHNGLQAIAFIDRAYRVVIDTSDLVGGTAKVTDEFMYKGEIARLEAVANTNYSFSHFKFLSGNPQINNRGIHTRITVLSDTKCLPIFTKVGPLALKLDRQTIPLEHYYGLPEGSPIRLKFTAPENGWFSFRHNVPTLDRYHNFKLTVLRYHGEDSTYTSSDTSLNDAINQVVFYSEKGKTTHLELVSFRNRWSIHKSIVMDVEKYYNLELEALPGGRLERTDHLFGYNNTIYINAAPENGSTFDSWLVDDTLAQVLNPRQEKGSFIFNSDTRISARFQDTILIIPVSSELTFPFSGNNNLKYTAPHKGYFSFIVTKDYITRYPQMSFFYNDSSYRDKVYSRTLTGNSDDVRFYADSAGQTLYFNLRDLRWKDYLDKELKIEIKPLFECRILKDVSDMNRTSHVQYSGPDVSCTLEVSNLDPRKRFVRWNVLSGTGDLLCDTSHMTVLNAHSDMVIEALYEEKEGYVLSEQKLVLPWTTFLGGDEAIELKYTAPQKGAYTLTLESRINARLRYHGTDSTLMRTKDEISHRDTIDFTFTADGGDDHFFTMFRSSDYPSLDSFNLYIKRTWQCLFAARENGAVSITDTAIVLRNDTLSVNAYAKKGYIMEEIRLLEGQAAVIREGAHFYVVPESDVLIEPVFTLRDYHYQYETYGMGLNFFRCSPPFTVGNSPYYTSRFAFDAPADGTYRICISDKAQSVHQITCFDQDSTFSRKSDAYQLTSKGPGCFVTCRGGSKNYFEINNFKNIDCRIERISFARSHKVRIIETDGGLCFPSEEFFVVDSSSRSLTAIPREGYQFKGWYTTSGSDTVFISEQNMLNPLIISDTTFYATFSKYSIHTITTKDTIVTMSSNNSHLLNIRGERFRFVAPDSGQYIFYFNYNNNNLGNPKSYFYGKDPTFYNFQSASSDRGQGWFHHYFWAENSGDTLYFEVDYSSSLPADVTVAAKKGYQVEFAVQGDGRLDPGYKVIVPHDKSFTQQVTIRPDPGYRLEKWVITEGNVQLSDSLSDTIDVSASSNGKVTAVLIDNRWFDLTSEPVGYSLKRDYYSADSGYTIRFRYMSKDTGMHSLYFPQYTRDFPQTAYYLGVDSSCIADAAVDREVLNSKSWINFRVTDTSETHYFMVNGYARQLAEDFQVQVVKPCKITVESENGTITIRDSYVPSGEFTTIEAIPDSGYGFEQWDLVEGEATFSERNSANCTVAPLTDCILRPTYRQPGAYELTSDFTEYSFAQNSYSEPPSTQVISFFFQPPKDGEYTWEMKEEYMPARPDVEVTSSDSLESLARIGKIDLPHSYKFNGKKGSVYSFKVISNNDMAGRFFIRVKGDDQSAIQNNGPQRPMVIYTEGGLFVAPNPVAQDRATCDLYLRAPFSGNAKLRIFDAVGNEIAFFRDYVTASRQTPSVPFYRWNLRNRNGRKVAAGTYLAVVTVEGIGTKKYMCKIGIRD